MSLLFGEGTECEIVDFLILFIILQYLCGSFAKKHKTNSCNLNFKISCYTINQIY